MVRNLATELASRTRIRKVMVHNLATALATRTSTRVRMVNISKTEPVMDQAREMVPDSSIKMVKEMDPADINGVKRIMGAAKIRVPNTNGSISTGTRSSRVSRMVP